MAEQMILIEHEGALYRGYTRGWPEEIWDAKEQAWIPYRGSVPKEVDWGTKISEEAARELMKP